MSRESEETIEERQIPYEKRCGPFVNMGSEYGVGKRNPVGKFNASNVSPIPMKAYKEDVYKKVWQKEKDR